MIYESTYYGLCSLGDDITHHGVKGQKWGVRRFQNPDGTLTNAGRKRYYTSDGQLNKKGVKLYNKDSKQLQKLKSYADVKEQAAAAKKYDERASKAMKVAGVSGLAALGLSKATPTNVAYLLTGANKNPFVYFRFPDGPSTSTGRPRSTRAIKTGAIAAATMPKRRGGDYREIDRIANEHYKKTAARFKKYDAISKLAAAGALGVSVASLGVAGYNTVKSGKAYRRLTKSGHEQAVRDYNAKLNEMSNKYGSLHVEGASLDKKRKV